MLFYKLFFSFLFDLAVWRSLETTYWLWLNIPYILMPYFYASWQFGIFLPTVYLFCWSRERV